MRPLCLGEPHGWVHLQGPFGPVGHRAGAAQSAQREGALQVALGTAQCNGKAGANN